MKKQRRTERRTIVKRMSEENSTPLLFTQGLVPASASQDPGMGGSLTGVSSQSQSILEPQGGSHAPYYNFSSQPAPGPLWNTEWGPQGDPGFHTSSLLPAPAPTATLTSRHGAPPPGAPRTSRAVGSSREAGGQLPRSHMRELLAETRSLAARVDGNNGNANLPLEFKSLSNQVDE